MLDLDKVMNDRNKAIAKKMKDRDDFSASDFFMSEKIVKTIPEDKIYLNSFDTTKILSVLPFTRNIYVAICPHCVRENKLKELRSFLERGAIIPILGSHYREFHPAVLDALKTREHISYYEFDIFRWYSVRNLTHRGLCSHCVDVRRKEIFASLKGTKTTQFKKQIGNTIYNLRPYIYPDYELLDQLVSASNRGDAVKLKELIRLSWGVFEIRTAQAFYAPITVDDSIIAKVPQGVVEIVDAADANDLKLVTAKGLGLTIPVDGPLDHCIEVLLDYQPVVSEIVAAIISNSVAADRVSSIELLSNNIAAINAEIERIESLKRYVMLETAIELFKSNRALVMGSLLAAAMGAAGGLVGCASSAVGATVTAIAKKKGWIRKSPAAERLGKMIVRDSQPYLDKLVSVYTGGRLPAVNVLSTRKKLAALEGA